MSQLHELVAEFIKRYRREFDFYDQAARVAAQVLQLRLEAAGIRAIVTSRAKSPDRLEAKILKRSTTKNYQSLQDIADDIVDLGGVRVALYFPGEREQVSTLVRDTFVLNQPPKKFPEGAHPTCSKRFSGYWATHFRGQMKETVLNEPQQRYREARLEIQVASVLMHAWAEVDHDLVYKPLEGALSGEEHALLDQLNGLVLVGEIALERLQKAGEARVGMQGRRFANHYDLAAYLLERTRSVFEHPPTDSLLGRVDVLFAFLQRVNLDKPDAIEPVLRRLDRDFEKRPLAEQIVDQLVAEDQQRYQLYEQVRAAKGVGSGFEHPVEMDREFSLHDAVGYFLSQWTSFEKFVQERSRRGGGDNVSSRIPTPRVLQGLGLYSLDVLRELENIRDLRNRIVHGLEVPQAKGVREAADRLRSIVNASRKLSPEAVPPM